MYSSLNFSYFSSPYLIELQLCALHPSLHAFLLESPKHLHLLQLKSLELLLFNGCHGLVVYLLGHHGLASTSLALEVEVEVHVRRTETLVLIV